MKFTKSIISIILTLSIVASMAAFLTVGSSAADNSLGDANSDAAINSFDALMIVRHCTGVVTLTSAELKAADVNGDKQVNATDALYILHFSVGKITSFPAGTPVDSGRVEIIGGFWYDPATGKVTNPDGSGLLGFSFDAKEGVFYASSNAWQRTFGYTYIYDLAAPVIICWFDTTRIFFEYDDKEWMVQLWKGQYGWVLIGAEIGLYYRDFGDNSLIDENGVNYFKCADDDLLIKMSMTLYRNNQTLFSRGLQYSWWLTGFVPGALDGFGSTPEAVQQVKLDAKLVFTDADMMQAFIKGLEEVDKVEHNATYSARNFEFKKGVNYNVNLKENSVSFTWQ
ncbi:MAG: DUF4474 domain-containing protein [Clostridia bacterium]|nr:DUF4474 domain-containing protein [Clostridia bacterium]